MIVKIGNLEWNIEEKKKQELIKWLGSNKLKENRKIDEFFSWVNELIGGIDDLKYYIRVENSEGESNYEQKYRYSEKVCFFTNNYKYVITAIDYSVDDGYLGCVSSCRRSKPGEDWLCGSDLPDGPLNRKTWEEIKNAIIHNELVELAPKISNCIQEDCLDNEEEEWDEEDY